jgi:hypothetical protein
MSLSQFQPRRPTSYPHFLGCETWLVWGICWTVAAAAPISGSQLPQADWLRADEATVRLDPSVFSSLPSSILIAMERRQCTVPQPFGSSRPRNVISGHFTQTGRIDWAVLCSRKKRSAVLVFHGKDYGEVDELGEAADSEYLQTVSGSGRIGFSRGLVVATPDVVRRSWHNGPRPRIVDRDGIADTFEGKGSVIWYWSDGKWIQLTGAD